MDIAYENVIPAYLESNQLIFEYENLGIYNNIVFPINTVLYEFKPEITVPYDIEIERKIQNDVDDGDQSWRLNPITTTHHLFNSYLISEKTSNGNTINYENISLLYCDDSSAVLKIEDNQSVINTVYLKRLIKKDTTGIWTIVGYDTNNKSQL